MLNERITENFVRDLLRKNSYYDIDNQIIIEEQKSQEYNSFLKQQVNQEVGMAVILNL
jgi:hypothetical protein